MSRFDKQEINAQVVISLMKAHGIKQVVASPGATNVTFIGIIQDDPFFTIYSAVDERSAAYIACGLAEESGEPVVLSCTGATASRNYIPGLTEAYYRKLPVLALTSTQFVSRIGHHIAQVIDRSSIQNDIVKHAVTLPYVKDDEDLWDCEIKVNQALLELTRCGGGPVHINLPTAYTLPSKNMSIPEYRVINRISHGDQVPDLTGKVAIFIGSHKKWNTADTQAIDKFCAVNDAVVFCDHSSGYKGKYRLLFSLIGSQEDMDNSQFKPDVLIHMGEISGDYSTLSMSGKDVWRVSEDGEIRDTFRKLRYVFEMEENIFFSKYSTGEDKMDSYLKLCQEGLCDIRNKLPELPFSNIWVASEVAPKLPLDSVLHLGILNSLRSWNFFEVDKSISVASNVGGFGIDGILSSLFGASLHKPESLYFCVLGDLAFFYDMNVMGNRHVGNNLRILMINNGKGTEFRQYNHNTAHFGETADQFMAAAEHFGNKSKTLVKNYAENLGFEYLSASNKDDFKIVIERFLNDDVTDKSMLLEVFTNSDDESDALKLMNTIIKNKKTMIKRTTKKLLGEKGIKAIKSILRS